MNLEKGQAVVTFAANAKITDTQLSQKIRDAGFVPGRIEWRAAPEQGTAKIVMAAREDKLSYLSLFTALGTLLCCALPSVSDVRARCNSGLIPLCGPHGL